MGMIVRRFVQVLLPVIIIVSAIHCAAGQGEAVVSGSESISLPHLLPSVGFKKFFNSFTSYQFPNPFAPAEDPLSRLEFPIDQWFFGLKQEYAARCWSCFCEGWINMSRESGLKMQDSDWDDELMPSQKTIFSESDCRLNRGLILEAGVNLPMPFGWGRSLRPVTGWRYQHFFFTTHDGYQAVLGDGGMDLPGDGIEFKQTFNQWYFGARFTTGGDLAALGGGFLPRVDLDLQFDYGLVTGNNEDHHLLREGSRLTTEDTRGYCWHACAILGLARGNTFNARLEADFKRIVTKGDHRLTNHGVDFSFDGSKVWSDQTSLTCFAEFVF
jgi:hypothetical protein